MATLAIVGIALAVIIAGGGVAWFVTDGFKSNDSEQQTASSATSSSSTTDAEAADNDKPSVDEEDSPKGGETITCTHTLEGEKFTSYWKSSELFRFDMNSPEGKVHTIAIDREFYVWGASLPTGIKMSAMSGQDLSGMSSISPDFVENLPGNANAKCGPYTGGDSIFQLPKDVTFRSMSGQEN